MNESRPWRLLGLTLMLLGLMVLLAAVVLLLVLSAQAPQPS